MIRLLTTVPLSFGPSQKALADELLRDLSDPKLTGSATINARIIRTNHLVLSGLRRKQVVLDWLARHGF